MLRHVRVLVLTVGALALGVAGCAGVPAGSVEADAERCPEGSDCYDVPRALGDGGSFTVDAGEFFFDNIQGTFWAGDIEVTLDNVGAAEHNIVFIGANEGSDDPVAQALGGEQDTGVVNLFEGDYVYYCSIPGHRSQGMEGTLTVYATEDEAAENLTEVEADPTATGAPDDPDSATEDGTEGETEPPATSDTGATETPTDAETSTEG